MATRQFVSKPRKGDRSSKSAEHVYGVPVPEGLHEAIEAERGNLSKAESLLGCLAISMEYGTDSETGPYYPDVAEIARDMVRQSINGLDSLTLQQHLLRNRVKEETDLRIIGQICPVAGPGPGDSNGASAREYRHILRSEIPPLAEAH